MVGMRRKNDETQVVEDNIKLGNTRNDKAKVRMFGKIASMQIKTTKLIGKVIK